MRRFVRSGQSLLSWRETTLPPSHQLLCFHQKLPGDGFSWLASSSSPPPCCSSSHSSGSQSPSLLGPSSSAPTFSPPHSSYSSSGGSQKPFQLPCLHCPPRSFRQPPLRCSPPFSSLSSHTSLSLSSGSSLASFSSSSTPHHLPLWSFNRASRLSIWLFPSQRLINGSQEPENG